MKDYFFLAFRNVRKRGIRSWLTMFGVFIGIAAVVSLISLGQGLETAISGQFGALSTDTLLVQGADTGFSPPGSTSVKKMTEHDLKIIEDISEVALAIPRLLRISKIEFNGISTFTYLTTMPEEQDRLEEVYKSLSIGVQDGRKLRTDDAGKIILGNDFKTNNYYEKEIRVGTVLKINNKNFEVVGFLEKSSTFTINGAILMMDDDARDLFDISEDEIDFIVVKVQDGADIEKVAEEIQRKIRKDRDQKIGEENFEVQTPTQSLESVSTILNVINVIVVGIALISLLVGGIGIANTMFTSVFERRKEIGVMKSIGAENKDILWLFTTESALLGLVGGITGALIGLGLAFAVAIFANSALGESIFQIGISWPLITGSIIFSLLIGVISGIIPAMQASKLHPVDALRGT